jgi:hypothetical protein
MHARLLLVPWVFVFLLSAAACGGGGDDDGGDDDGGPAAPEATVSPFPNDNSRSPLLEMPASRFSISQDDLGPGYITDIEFTWNLDGDSYGRTKTFPSPEEGWRLLNEWGYLGGYETSYSPEGYARAVLEGAYNVAVETHLFSTEEGAKAAYQYFKDRLSESISRPVSAFELGNESSAWLAVDTSQGIAGSSVAAELHRYLLRRGNLLAMVVTYGAEPFMDVAPVYRLAHIVDAKAIGELEAVEPTPVSKPAGN